eukprot:7430536-Heterocapsa_arctica.AAC.1
MAVLVAVPAEGTPGSTDRSQKLRVYDIGAMRAVSGHSLRIDQTKIATPLLAQHANLLSALTHKTLASYIPDIIKYGLRPGGLPPPGIAPTSSIPG